MKDEDMWGGILCLFFGIVGDIASRIIFKNASLDNWYLTMPFFGPPLSIVSAIFWFLGTIKKEQNKSGIIDGWTYLIFMLPITVIDPFIKSISGCEAELFPKVLFYIIIMYFARMHRKQFRCNNADYDTTYQLHEASVLVFSSVCVYFLFDLCSNLPFIGGLFRIWDMLKCIGNNWNIAIIMTLSQIIMNIIDINNREYRKDMLCSKKKSNLFPFPNYFPFSFFFMNWKTGWKDKYLLNLFSMEGEDWELMGLYFGTMIVIIFHKLYIRFRNDGCPLF